MLRIGPHKSDTTSLLGSTLHNAWALIPNPINETDFQRSVLPNLIPSAKPSVMEDVVMITHISASSRLNNLLIQIRWWNGPVAVAVYIKSKQEIDDFLEFIPKLLATQSTQIHIVLEKTKLNSYPHNVMRNLVMDQLQSDYFVALDADLVTNPNAHDSFLKLIQTNKKVRRRLHSKYLFVLPAFEKFPLENQTSPTEDMLPRTKEELIQMDKNKTLSLFHPNFPRGHKPTNFAKWKMGRRRSNTKGDFFDIEYNLRFEPYVLGYRHGKSIDMKQPMMTSFPFTMMY
jgi:glycosyltransferase-like protein LARGE